MEEYLEIRDGRASVEASFVYFALSGRRVKIGISKNPRERLKSIRTGSYSKVNIYYVTPGGREKEKELHALFAQYRVNGEWFIYAKEIQDWIAADEAARWAKGC
jgi:hypothetical protein